MSQCIIVADAGSQQGKALVLRQVIEALAYNRAAGRVAITLDLLVENEGPVSCQLLLVHRGTAVFEEAATNLLWDTGKLGGSSVGGQHPSDAVLRAIYKRRITSAGAERRSFSERVNCFSFADAASPVAHSKPGLLRMEPRVVAQSGDEDYVFLPYTCVEVGPFPPGLSWFRTRIRLSGPTYRQFVELQERFWVDGPARVIREIARGDLPERGSLCPEAQGFFDARIVGSTLDPRAYDVVVFRPGVEGVDVDTECTPVTGDVYRAMIDDSWARDMAHLFVTRSASFWIDVVYVRPDRLAPAAVGIEPVRETALVGR